MSPYFRRFIPSRRVACVARTELVEVPSLSDLPQVDSLRRLASRATRRPNFGNLLGCAEDWRRRAREVYSATCGRVGKVELMRVKVVSDVTGERSTISSGCNDGQATGTIQRVVNQGMSGNSKVNPDLMGAAGDEIDTNQAPIVVGIAVEHPAFRSGRFTVARCRVQVPGWRIGNPTDGNIHRKPIGHVRAGDECAVYLAYPPVSEILGKDPSCRFGSGEQNDAGGSPPKSMQGRGARGFRVVLADAGEQRVAEMMAAGQYGEAGGFGYGDKVLILVEQRERTGSVGLTPGPSVVSEPLARSKRCILRGGVAIQPYCAG